ncbi:hypothetical protein C6499_11610 [Candidatus Poribacteria bacterium]|nr:MAG: hypothetical protein C6499_11610 [Candidatus Poribacteria bacterium]
MSKLLEELNPSQREAVTHKSGPLLIIAGPGSGKTRTVVHSIAYAIEILGILPDKILAFSFTVKASQELKERVIESVDEEKGQLVNVFTFHSFCRKVLKEDLGRLHRTEALNFQDLDEDEQEKADQRRVAQAINHLQYKSVNSGDVLNFIIKCKTLGVRPSEAENHTSNPKYVEIYEKYEQRLKEDGRIDYPNQLLFTDELLTDVPEVKKKWQEKFDLIFVDEYQDTDPVQYRIIKALAEKHQNLRVVGDDDQGIYGWRGADIQNILNFEQDYPNAKVIPLGQNYRSTQRIVEASRALADFNPDRREKELFTRNREGEKVKHLHCENADVEANTIADFISRSIKEGKNPNDFAALYRTKKQAKLFKTAFDNLGIPFHEVKKSSDRDTHGVSLMTIHKSKGLEFPNVFVVGVCKNLLPNYYNRHEKDWDEELRLLYVAMTRAKNWLCLSSYDYDEYKRGRSPFLERGYISASFLESVETLQETDTPPIPEEMIVQNAVEQSDALVEPLPISPQTVIGIDPGNIGANTTNVGWSVTQKSADGYSVLCFDTENPEGTPENRLQEIKQKIDELIAAYSPDAIAVEKLEISTQEEIKDWFFHVARCVVQIGSIASEHGIERYLYTPQQVKYIATSNRNASKEDVQKGVKLVCNLSEIPEPHHSADAIATSLCYLRSYLNSARFEGNKRKREHYETGCDYLDRKQYEKAINTFKETINIDPAYTDAHCGLGRAYLVQNNLDRAETAAKTALRLGENNHPDSQKLLGAITHYRSGCNFLNISKWNIAIAKFRESINLEPIFTEAHYELGKAHFEVGNLEAAKDAAEEALKLRYQYPSAQKLLVDIKKRYYYNGEIYFNREEYARAISEFQKAVEIDPDFKGAHRFVGEAYLKLGDLEKAEKGAREALRIHPNYELAQGLLEKIKQKHKEDGDDYRKKKAFPEALTSYQQAIRIDNKYKEAYHNLGILYRRMKKYDKAITAYQRVIDIDERSHVTYSDFSFVYRDIGETAKAVDLLKRAIAIKPDYQRAYYNLADTYFEMENLQDASEKVLEALRLDDNDQDTLKLQKNIVHAYLKQGRDYFKQGNLEAAKISAKATLKLDSNYQLAHKLLDDIKQTYYKQGLVLVNRAHPEAINALQKAVEIDPDFKEAHYSLGEFYFKIGDLEAAKKETREALQIDPNYKLASCLLISIKEEYCKRGLTSLKQNEWRAAEKFAREVLRIDPNYEPANELLKQAYYEQGLAHIDNERYVEGINELQKAKDIDPNCEKTHFRLGLAYFKLDRLKDAQTMVEEALSIQSNYPLAQKLLIEIKDARNWLKVGGAKVRELARWIANRIGF